MVSEQRASIAAICAMAVNGGGHYSRVFDYSRSSYVPLSIYCNLPLNITIFDYKRSCYVQGNLSSVFDYGTRAYISLNVNGNTAKLVFITLREDYRIIRCKSKRKFTL